VLLLLVLLVLLLVLLLLVLLLLLLVLLLVTSPTDIHRQTHTERDTCGTWYHIITP
jgi:uncharacterized membrane-anchored protein